MKKIILLLIFTLLFLITGIIYNYFRHKKRDKIRILNCEQDDLKEIVKEYKNSKIDFSLIMISIENIYEIFNFFGYHKLEIILEKISLFFGKFAFQKNIYRRDYILILLLQNHKFGTVESIIKKMFLYIQKTPLKIEGVSIYLNISLGWALSSEGDYEEIIEKGYSRIKSFETKEETRYLFGDKKFDLTKLIFEFNNSLNNNEFYLVYQPKFDLFKNEISGVEALIRWKHKKYGEIPPLDYIPYLEKTNFINELTFWVLNTVILDMKDWAKKNINLKVSINICPRNILDEEFVKRMNLIIKINMPFTRNFQFELTETDLMVNVNSAKKVLENFKKDKIEIHIDDFGTGYSSLAYLRELPIDCLKVDKSFIKDLNTSEVNMEIVKTTVNMAHNLGKKVIIEGVESQEVLNLLKKINCDEIQGYYFSRPLKKAELEKFISEKYLLV